RPGAYMRDSVRKGVNVAIAPVGVSDLTSKPIVGDTTLAHQETIEGHRQFRVGRGRDLALIRYLTNIPQPLDALFIARHAAHVLIAREVVEHLDILGDRRAR